MKALPGIRLVLVLGAVLTLPATAQAQGVLRFVGLNGNDAGPCSRSQPCRTLQAGVNATPAGAELQILDSAGYGSVTITRSITISADGVAATVISPADGSDAITINGEGAVVTLRGLLLSGQGTGDDGIEILEAAALHIENCQIERFVRDGLFIESDALELFIADSVFRDNGRDGLNIIGTSADAKLTVENSRFENNGDDGLDIGSFETSITRSSVSGNGDYGVWQTFGTSTITETVAAHNGGGGFYIGNVPSGQLTLEHSVARGNDGPGLRTTGSIARLSNSVITNNAVGVEFGGSFESRMNNTIIGNAGGNIVFPVPR